MATTANSLQDWYNQLDQWYAKNNDADYLKTARGLDINQPKAVVDQMFKETNAAQYVNPYYLSRMRDNAGQSAVNYQVQKMYSGLNNPSGSYADMSNVYGNTGDFLKQYIGGIKSPYQTTQTTDSRGMLQNVLQNVQQGQKDYQTAQTQWQKDWNDYYASQGKNYNVDSPLPLGPAAISDDGFKSWMNANGRQMNYWNPRMQLNQVLNSYFTENPDTAYDWFKGVLSTALGPQYGGMLRGAMLNRLGDEFNDQQYQGANGENWTDFMLRLLGGV
jgi:hypothetical protein